MKNAKVWAEHLYLSREFQAVCALMLFTIIMFVNIGSVRADTIFDGLDQGSDGIVSKITDAYCNNVFPILLVITLVGSAITSGNQKLFPIFTRALKIVCIIFVGCKLLDLIVGTLEWLSDQLGAGGTGGTGTVPTTGTAV